MSETIDSLYAELYDVYHCSELELGVLNWGVSDSESDVENTNTDHQEQGEISWQKPNPNIERWLSKISYEFDESQTPGISPTLLFNAGHELDLLDLNRCRCLLEEDNCLACETYIKYLACLVVDADENGMRVLSLPPRDFIKGSNYFGQ